MYGVWAKMREEFLRVNHPDFYHSLAQSGELFSYLQHYQEIYSKRADSLTKNLQLEYGLDDNLDSVSCLVDSFKIFLTVRKKLRSEIQK